MKLKQIFIDFCQAGKVLIVLFFFLFLIWDFLINSQNLLNKLIHENLNLNFSLLPELRLYISFILGRKVAENSKANVLPSFSSIVIFNHRNIFKVRMVVNDFIIDTSFLNWLRTYDFLKAPDVILMRNYSSTDLSFHILVTYILLIFIAFIWIVLKIFFLFDHRKHWDKLVELRRTT